MRWKLCHGVTHLRGQDPELGRVEHQTPCSSVVNTAALPDPRRSRLSDLGLSLGRADVRVVDLSVISTSSL